ncbi:MAG: hypothetical protein RIB45_14860 [Marivibrio sp.]|uniref:hypothetical protein n=1 Tax=Marivibrio sp. TaxID=2039719 RepID=UPI0032EEBA5A
MTDGSDRRLRRLKPLDAGALARLLDREGAPRDAVSRGETRAVPLADAVSAARLEEAAAELDALSSGGVIDWRRFDVTRFAALMPSLAYLDRMEGEDGAPDFVYRFVGETIQQVARRTLRGARISDILVGEARRSILDEYAACLDQRRPRASIGRVVVSDMTWLRYLRLLYPAATDGTTPDRLLLIMLFAEG